MYVCVCNAVTERHIAQAVQQGARQLKDLRRALRVSADCGRCARCAHQCLQATLTSPDLGRAAARFPSLMLAEA
ncbi:MAG: bacterioferritin [Gammaproteobacteria bacterium]|nr:bacterioferritin [Gammaproteobacteria bacterium]